MPADDFDALLADASTELTAHDLPALAAAVERARKLPGDVVERLQELSKVYDDASPQARAVWGASVVIELEFVSPDAP